MADFLETFDTSGKVQGIRFCDLSSLAQGYVQALFFTDTGPDQMSDGLGSDCTFADLSPEALGRIVADCNAFDLAACRPLVQAYALNGGAYNGEAAGRDFHYTRNGHGCGFWDRDLEEIGEQLSEIARGFGSVDLYRGDDGTLYLA